MLLCQVMVRQLQQLQIKSIKVPKYRAKKHQLCVSDAAWLHHEMVYRSSCWVGPLENNMSNLILTSIDILAIHLDCWWWALSFCHISRKVHQQTTKKSKGFSRTQGLEHADVRAPMPKHKSEGLKAHRRGCTSGNPEAVKWSLHSEDLPILPDKSTWM